MGLLISAILALSIPFLILLEWHLLVYFGATNSVATLLTVISLAIGFIGVLIDTSGFDRKSSLVKLIEDYEKRRKAG